MISFPNAKINIGLNILEKRKDGFHNIETVFYPIELKDILEFTESDKDSVEFENTGIEIAGDIHNNLVVKAYKLLANDFEIPNIKIHLHKIIPFGAGLGGGSADSACMLTSLNETYKLGLSNQQLKNYASKLGSDCSFFIDNVPSYADRKGDNIMPISLDLSGYRLVLVNPYIHICTSEAYSLISPKLPDYSLKDLINLPIENWKDSIYNDFEPGIFFRYPEIKAIKDKFYQIGAVYASMSGSGSSVYGIFKERINLNNYFPNYYVWVGTL